MADPVLVDESPLLDQLWAGVRQVAPVVGTFLIAKGYIDNTTLAVLAGVGTVAWPIVAGQIKVRERHCALARAAADPKVDSVQFKASSGG